MAPAPWREKKNDEPMNLRSFRREHWANSGRGEFWRLAAFIVLVFLTGGASRDDVLSLPLLRGVCAVAFTWMLIVRPRSVLRFRLQLLVLGAFAVVIAMELIPLPPSLWHALPGRTLIWQIDQAAELDIWRPLTVDTHATWNALFSLVVPATAFACIAASGPNATASAVKVFVAIIGVAAMLGLFQLLAGSGGLYLYRITNSDSSVGFMANRNHHALMLACGMPMLAYLIGNMTGAPNKVLPLQMATILFAIILFPFVALTGSRAGLLLAAVSFAGALLAYRSPTLTGRRIPAVSKKLNSKLVWVVLGVTAVSLSLLAGRITAFDRLANSNSSEVDRLSLLPTLWKMAGDYFPFGAGAGSFPSAFRLYETDALLQPAYYNHAHNDALEIVIEHGVAGILLIGAGALLWLWAAWRILLQRRHIGPSSSNSLALAGLTILFDCGLSSLVDYPLRVPAIQVLACFSVAWVCDALRTPVRSSDGKIAWARKGSHDLIGRAASGRNPNQ
jgi:O-antigen ligase